VDRRVALGVLWALFAAASVGVGFGAAGLVNNPFTGTGGDLAPVAVPPSTAEPTDRPSTGSPAPAESEPAVRGFSTRACFVSGSCSGGLVAVSASPAVGWSLDDVDSGRRDEARVRFEHSDGDGRVEVTAWCERGVPRFSAEDRDRGGDDDGSSGTNSGHG
jgi:hypothetical protein